MPIELKFPWTSPLLYAAIGYPNCNIITYIIGTFPLTGLGEEDMSRERKEIEGEEPQLENLENEEKFHQMTDESLQAEVTRLRNQLAASEAAHQRDLPLSLPSLARWSKPGRTLLRWTRTKSRVPPRISPGDTLRNDGIAPAQCAANAR